MTTIKDPQWVAPTKVDGDTFVGVLSVAEAAKAVGLPTPTPEDVTDSDLWSEFMRRAAKSSERLDGQTAKTMTVWIGISVKKDSTENLVEWTKVSTVVPYIRTGDLYTDYGAHRKYVAVFYGVPEGFTRMDTIVTRPAQSPSSDAILYDDSLAVVPLARAMALVDLLWVKEAEHEKTRKEDVALFLAYAGAVATERVLLTTSYLQWRPSAVLSLLARMACGGSATHSIALCMALGSESDAERGALVPAVRPSPNPAGKVQVVKTEVILGYISSAAEYREHRPPWEKAKEYYCAANYEELKTPKGHSTLVRSTFDKQPIVVRDREHRYVGGTQVRVRVAYGYPTEDPAVFQWRVFTMFYLHPAPLVEREGSPLRVPSVAETKEARRVLAADIRNARRLLRDAVYGPNTEPPPYRFRNVQTVNARRRRVTNLRRQVNG